MDATNLYIPLILALTEVAKKIGIDLKWSPVIAMVLGMVFSGITYGFDINTLIQGLIWGLASCGLWNGGKTLGKALGLRA